MRRLGPADPSAWSSRRPLGTAVGSEPVGVVDCPGPAACPGRARRACYAPYSESGLRLAGLVYSFGPFRLEAHERRLLRDGSVIALPGKAFDTLLLLVDQVGVACHTGRRTCFYRAVRGGFVNIVDVTVDPEALYKF